MGAVSRYGLSEFVQKNHGFGNFPLGTLVVNVLGCLFIGFLANVLEAKQLLTEEIRLFIIVGILGGFTTFSTFGHETVNLFKDAFHITAVLNIFLQIILCLFAAWAGYFLSKAF